MLGNYSKLLGALTGILVSVGLNKLSAVVGADLVPFQHELTTALVTALVTWAAPANRAA